MRMAVRDFNPRLLPKVRLAHTGPLPEEFDLEIGAGVGEFAIRYAQQNPTRFLVAIEHTKLRFSKFEQRYKEAGEPSNLLPVHANGISWVYQFVRRPQINRVFFMYPNPYVKKRQANHRWHRSSFMHYLLRVMKPGGQIELRTNLSFYAKEAVEYFDRFWNLKVRQCDAAIHPLEAQTPFERKYLHDGQQLFRYQASLRI